MSTVLSPTDAITLARGVAWRRCRKISRSAINPISAATHRARANAGSRGMPSPRSMRLGRITTGSTRSPCWRSSRKTRAGNVAIAPWAKFTTPEPRYTMIVPMAMAA
jgi:hypothetical protein